MGVQGVNCSHSADEESEAQEGQRTYVCKNQSGGLPWCSSGSESALQCRDVGSILGRGTKIPHAARQLSPCATVKTQHSQKRKREREKETAGFEPQFLHLPRLSTALPYKRMAGQAPRSRHGISDWQDSNLKCYLVLKDFLFQQCLGG